MTAPAFDSLDQLLAFVPGIDPARIRLVPTPGMATETDLIRLWEEDRILCEMTHGVLVQKVTGFAESVVASRISAYISIIVGDQDLGIVAGEAGMLRIAPGLVRIPDVSFVSWEQFPGHRIPAVPIPSAHPDLAVEVLNPSNTDTEITRKIGEYFASGTRLVWVVDPPARTVAVYTTPDKPDHILNAEGTLTCGEVLAGFELPIEKVFREL